MSFDFRFKEWVFRFDILCIFNHIKGEDTLHLARTLASDALLGRKDGFHS